MTEEKYIKQKTPIWTVWIDENNRIISMKEIPNAKQLYFKNGETGLKTLNALVAKGYKIG